MAVSKKKKPQPAKSTTEKLTTKLTAAEARKKVEELEDRLKKIEDGGYCTMCAKHKAADKFYYNSDPMTASELSPICRECARKIALRVDKNGEEHEPTKESVQLTLRYLNRPFLNTVWNASIQESENLVTGRVKHNVWSSYAKNIQMQQYLGLTYFDSDFFKEKVVYEDEQDEYNLNKMSKDAVEDYEKNKADVTRLLGYDPFEHEALADQPFLYSQLLGLMDTGGNENDDMLRNSSCITIVRGFLQASKIDNSITGLMGDIKNIEKNSATIKSLQESKAKITSMITDLAAESCISLKNNKNAKKGENTWTGKIKKIKDLNLRSSEVNGFDIATCRGMQQVQEISDASIMKQLALDESEWSDMVAQMRETIVDLRKEKDAYQEINRIILRENIDLRDTLKENELLKEDDIVNLKDLYSIFADFDVSKKEDTEDKNDKENTGDTNETK